MKNISRYITLVFVALFVVIATRLLSQTDAGTARCSETFIIQTTASAPTTVTSGGSFQVSNIVYTGSGFGSAEVISEELTFSVSGASPSTFTVNWSGSYTGSTPVSLGSQTLAATGSAGSQIVVSLQEISTTTAEFGNIKCSIANGALQASQPGESLVLISATIAAPPQPDPTPTPTPTPSTPTPTPPEEETTEEETTQPEPTLSTEVQSTEIFVFDRQNNPIVGAEVRLDENTQAITDENGIVRFANVRSGLYTVVVSLRDELAQRIIFIPEDTSSATHFVNIGVASFPALSPSTRAQRLYIFGLVGVVASVGTAIAVKNLRRRRKFAKAKPQNLQPKKQKPPKTKKPQKSEALVWKKRVVFDPASSKNKKSPPESETKHAHSAPEAPKSERTDNPPPEPKKEPSILPPPKPPSTQQKEAPKTNQTRPSDDATAHADSEPTKTQSDTQLPEITSRSTPAGTSSKPRKPLKKPKQEAPKKKPIVKEKELPKPVGQDDTPTVGYEELDLSKLRMPKGLDDESNS